MNSSPLLPQFAPGFVQSAAEAARTNGVSATPSTSGRTSRIQTWPCSAWPGSLDVMGRMSHIGSQFCTPYCTEAGIASGLGTFQSGGAQTVPDGFSERFSSTAVPRADEVTSLRYP